jgi:hypothetical protein
LSDIFSGSDGQIPVRQACTVVYKTLPRLDAAQTRAALQQLVGPCMVEWASIGAGSVPVVGGIAQFDVHRIVMIALNAQVRPEVLDATVGVSPMPEDERQALLDHGAAIRVLYVGDADDPIDQLTAMYQVAGVLLDDEGLGIINERAALALPARLAKVHLPQLGSEGQKPEIPPISLWTGVITYSASNEQGAREGFLLRTYGMDQCSLPELAIFIPNRTQADAAYHILINVCLYLVQSGPMQQVGIGDRIEFRERTYLLTDPGYNTPEFASQTGLLLLVEV